MFDKEIRLLERSLRESPKKGGAGNRGTIKELAWCFPNTYAIAMSGLGYQLIYHLLESEPDLDVKRMFLDIEESVSRDCRLFGFTMSWELDFINLLAMLKKHNIPWLAKDRTTDHPIVFAGGPVLTANPEPYAEIFDLVLLGDAEETIPRFIESLRRAEERDIIDRQAKLRFLAETPGIYVPSFYWFEFEDARDTSCDAAIKSVRTLHDSVQPQVAKQLFRAPDDYVAHSIILTPDTTWGDIFLIELARSCPQECRFCLASYLTRPFRSAEVETVLSKVDLALSFTNKIGLMGPSITEHPHFSEIVDGLIEKSDRMRASIGKQLKVSVASVRADTLEPDLISKLRSLDQKSVTIALESGSERLRSIMKKNLSDDQILHAVDAIASGGMVGVKFYLIAGLPYEEWNDLEETVRLFKVLKKAHRNLKLKAGISSFVPKAQTPFQWRGRDRNAKKKIEFLRKNLVQMGIEVRPESHNWSDIQALLSRGDRRLTEVLLNVAAHGETLGAWKQALRERSVFVPSLDYYAYRDIPENEPLPWSHLAQPDRTVYLSKHLLQARESART